MREITFRAWDGKAMHYGVTQWFISDIDNKPHLVDDYPLETLMQYTGLKDKNGKHIYEGDIIKYRHSQNSPEYIGPIEYKDFYASFLIKTSDESGFSLLGQQKIIEVIGNIHESPELLIKGGGK